MKNVLFIVIDSVYEAIMRENPDICPFIQSIKDQSLYFSNVYSQGPYTEAGTKGLLCSENTLDNETYLFRYSKAKNFISGIFHDNGYKTSSIIYPTTLYNDKIIEKLDGIYHTAVFMPNVFWGQKILFYKDKWQKQGLTEQEYNRIYELLKDVLGYWLYSVDVEHHPENARLFDKYNKAYPYSAMYALVSGEKEKFTLDPRAYVDEMFATNGGALNTDMFGKTNFIQNDAIRQAEAKRKAFCAKLVGMQLKLAMRRMKTAGKAILHSKNKTDAVRYLKMWCNEMRESFDILTPRKSKDFKLLLSAGAQLDFAADLLTEEKNVPQFVMVHVEEPHYYNSFFTYDCDDPERIVREFDYAEVYLNKIKKQKGKKYDGFLYYDLSLRYVDLQIEYAVEKLRREGVLDNTTIVITSDHGSSYTGRRFRQNRTINFYDENYHIPFIIYDQGIAGRTVSEMASNLDIIPTVLDICGLKAPVDLDGHDILHSPAREHVFIEYMGPGCPDIYLRPVWLAIRNEAYKITYIGSVFDEFSADNIQAIYDLGADPNELENIKNKKKNEEIEKLIDQLCERFCEIKRQYM